MGEHTTWIHLIPAYWNLQDRPLRWAALDDGPADLWTLEGQPIVVGALANAAYINLGENLFSGALPPELADPDA